VESLRKNWRKSAEWFPALASDKRERAYAKWKKAVQRTMDWVDEDEA
jgi:glycerol kinase